jgi:spore germination protein YaaH
MKKIFYRVKREDTIFTIASEFGVSVFSLIEENNLTCEIEDGDILIINEKEELYFPKPLETFYTISKKFGVSEDRLRLINKAPYVIYGIGIRIK